MRHQLFLGVAAAALVFPAAASAQETTSIIQGAVTDESGAAVAGAKVTITHVPSGSVSTVTTNTDGQFQSSGLRVGGPFQVVVEQNGAVVATVSDVFTQLGQPYQLPIAVASAAQDVVVSASKIRGSGTNSLGPQTLLRAEQISQIASVNRDVRDLARRDPFATIDLANNRAVSFAGVNPRFNVFTVNGVRVNDRFGLNSDANPTRRGPVPLDAIDQFTVSVSPVDIRQGNFTGGAIDLVLRSGTNKYEGTGFYSINSDGLTGNQIGATTVRNNFTSQTYGGRLSGPIIKDKLFIMVAAERTTQALPNTTGPAGEGFGTEIPNLTRAQITQVQNIAQTVYNYNTGDTIRSNDEVDEKIVGRIDWNITNGQKLFLTFTNAYDSLVIPQGNSSSPTTPAVGLRSNGYLLTELQRSGQIQLNSDWTDSFSTEVRGGYLSFRRGQDSLQGLGFGQFTVCLDPTSATSATAAAQTSNQVTCNNASPRVVFGPDVSRQANQFFADSYQGSVQARLNLGDHSLKVLAEFEEYRVYNLFVQNALGTYNFDSIADFQNRRAGTLTYQTAISGNLNDAAANFKTRTWTFGVQDTWKLAPNFTVTGGVRYDLYDQNGAIALNNFLVARSNIANTGTLAGIGLFQPRVGFDWKPLPRLSVRGSAGIYGGGSPAVYISNSYANTGILTNTINIQRTLPTTPTNTTPGSLGNPAAFQGGVDPTVGNAALAGVDGRTFQQPVTNFLTTNLGALAGSTTNILDPNFRIPSVARVTLSVDYKANFGPLGDGWNFGLAYLYSKPQDQVVFTDIRSIRSGLLLPDGRFRYRQNPGLAAASVNTDLLTTNSSAGRSHIFVAKFDKRFDFGLYFGGSYTWQDVTDASPATSSVAFSNFTNAAFGDPNIQAVGVSNDETKWQFKYNIGFERAFFGDYKTRFQIFGETRAGRPYSFTFQDNTSAGRSNVFGTVGNLSNVLLYVPTGLNDARVSYGNTLAGTTVTQTAAQTQAFLDTLINTSALSRFRGQVAPRNIARARAFTRIDLHVEQEIPTFVGKSRITVYADIENLPNLLNSNWGGLRQFGFPQTAAVVRVQCLTTAVADGVTPSAAQITSSTAQACAQYRYTQYIEPNTGLLANPLVGTSLYAIRIGARITF